MSQSALGRKFNFARPRRADIDLVLMQHHEPHCDDQLNDSLEFNVTHNPR